MKPWQWVAAVVGVLVAAGGGIVIASPWSGPPVNVPSSINSACGSDVTTALAAWVAAVPSGSQIVFPPSGCYEVNGSAGGPALLISNKKNILVNGNGSTFDDPTSNWPTDSSIWEVFNGYNINFENMTIEGSWVGAGNFNYSTGGCYPGNYAGDYEYQFGIDYQATQGGTVNNVTISGVGGDFVEVDYNHVIGATNSLPATNITIENSTLTNNGRMGIGIVDGVGVKIVNDAFSGVCWEAVDMEAGTGPDFSQNVSLINNTLGSSEFGLLSDGGTSNAANNGGLTVTGNVMTAYAQTSEAPIQLDPITGTVTTGFTITGNTLISNGGDGISISNETNGTINNNTIGMAYNQGPTVYPVALLTPLSGSLCDSITINNNTGSQYIQNWPAGAVYVDPSCTNITQSGNTIT